METAARLAAYLSGDLDANERAAVEAELAADPATQARLDRIRRADAALADLPDERLSPDAEQRLHAAVGTELDVVLGDELAARRRTMPRWLPAMAAAGLVVVVGGGVLLTGTMTGGEDAATTADAPEAGPDRGEDAGAAGGEEAADTRSRDDTATESAAPLGPRVVAAGRILDEQALAELAADPMLLQAVGGLPVDDPAATAAAHTRVLGATPPDGEGQDGETPGTVPSVPGGTGQGPTIVSEGEVTETELADIARCLPVLQADVPSPVVPLYAELAEDPDGAQVIAYAALTRDDTGGHRRVEVWLLDRSSCSMRRFLQHDR